MFRARPTALAVAWALAATPAVQAADGGPPIVQLDAVIVTANPLGSDLFELVPPAALLEGQGLLLQKRSTLGETVSHLPGMSSTGFGPNASRPVIRGLDADRIRVLHNGTGMLDASSLSFDHAVAVDPMATERVEVVRGSAALLYGGNAVGGVVNVIDSRIAKAPSTGMSGSVEARMGGAEGERSGSARITAGNGRFVLNADAYSRDTVDLRIKGPAVSDRLRAEARAGNRDVAQELLDARTRLPNSSSTSTGGGLGGTLFWGNGSAGLEYSAFDTDYGTVVKPAVRIDMKSTRWNFAGELFDLQGPVSGLKLKWGQTQYEHRELDAGAVGTIFKSSGPEARLEALHRPLGPLTGSLGLQLGDADFSALGDEAFVPQTRTRTRAVFLYEELPAGKLKLNFGGRLERIAARSEGGGNKPTGQVNPRFGAAQERSFNSASSSIGALYLLSKGVALTVNLASTQRAPTATELYANGPHAATGTYEVGNPGFDTERARSLDTGLKLRSGPNSASFSVFHTQFRNFITAFRSGANRAADGEVAPVDVGSGKTAAGFTILPAFAFRAVPAVFAGFEAQGRVRLLDRGSTLDLQLRADYTQARNADTGAPLPRIAPMRIGASLVHGRQAVTARLDVNRIQGQGRVAANELPTDGHTLVDASASWRFKSGPADWETFLRATNLLNVNARNHVSFLKDQAPLPGRGVLLGLRAGF